MLIWNKFISFLHILSKYMKMKMRKKVIVMLGRENVQDMRKLWRLLGKWILLCFCLGVRKVVNMGFLLMIWFGTSMIIIRMANHSKLAQNNPTHFTTLTNQTRKDHNKFKKVTLAYANTTVFKS